MVLCDIHETVGTYLVDYNESTNTMKCGFVQMFADILTSDELSSVLVETVTYAHSLCGLFALFYICNIVWKSWASGNQLDLLKIIKPLVIGMCIMNFSLIVSTVDLLVSGLGLASQEFSDACSKKSGEQFQKQFEDLFENSNLVHDNTSTKSVDEQAIESDEKLNSTKNKEIVAESNKTYEDKEMENKGVLASLASDIVKELSEWISSSSQWLCAMLASVAMVCILFVGYIGKCIFYFFGPILFAMELIPGMEGKIVGFFKKYLTYSLYPICINVINGVLVFTMVTISETDSYGSLGSYGSYTLTHVVVSFIGMFAFLSVPSLANQITEAASSTLSDNLQAGAIKFGSIAMRGATGGASKMAAGASKFTGAKHQASSAKKAAGGSNMKGGGT